MDPQSLFLIIAAVIIVLRFLFGALSQPIRFSEPTVPGEPWDPDKIQAPPAPPFGQRR